MMLLRGMGLLFCILLLGEAAHANPFHQVDPSDLQLDAGPQGSLDDFKQAVTRQIAVCEQLDPNEVFHFGSRAVTRQKWCIDTNRKFLEIANLSKDFWQLLVKARDTFDWYQTSGYDGNGSVLFTAYNFPVSTATLRPQGDYQFPLYLQPDNLVQVQIDGDMLWKMLLPNNTYGSFPTREQIDVEGVLKGHGLEAAYLNDEFSAFLYHIEGSGAVLLPQPDGTQKRVVLDFAAENGRPYSSIGKILEQEGVDPKYLSIPGMREYFREHPDQLMPTLVKDQSYVFFRMQEDGPYGSSTALLTPMHSIAVDESVFPMGAVSFFHTLRPVVANGAISEWTDMASLAVMQDTGGAINGPGHIDLYWGEGDTAEVASGYMKQDGSLYIAVLP